MKTFIHHVSNEIISKHQSDLKNVLVVVPSKRSIIYFHKEFAHISSGAIELPVFKSIEELVTDLSGLEIGEPIEFLFEFYHIYQKIEKENPQSFEEFSTWAPTMIKDFSDIDSQMINSDDFFKYVSHYFELQLWDPSPGALTDFQKKYLKFWKSLHLYYKELNSYLKSKSFTYRGALFKSIAQKLKQKDANLLQKLKQWEDICLVGFNALTKSEEAIFTTLHKNFQATCFFDADQYFLQANYEAGHFIRKYMKEKEWAKPTPFFPSQSYLKEQKTINIYGINSTTELAQFNGSLLKKSPDSATILADESILLPVLNHLPASLDKINITLGYPLALTHFYEFIILLAKLQDLCAKKKAFYHEYVTSLLRHPITLRVCDVKAQEFINQLTKQNLMFVSEKFIHEKLKLTKPSFLATIFSIWTQSSDHYLERFSQLCQFIEKQLESKLEKEYLFKVQTILKKLQTYISQYPFLSSTSTLIKIFETIAQQTSVSFIGEPLGGTQIMGILETRLLDFEKIIVLSVNEGVLPKVKFEHSFIPFEIKKYFNLATYKERDAIFAYHFYRLLQRSKDVSLLYLNHSGNDLQKGEMSRYIMQLTNEVSRYNPKITLSHTQPQLSKIYGGDLETTEVKKTSEVIKKINDLLNQGMSSTAFTTYLSCPLDFYHRYILGIKEQNEMEEEVSSKNLGTVIHNTLYQLYAPFQGKLLDTSLLVKSKQNINKHLEKAFKELYPTANFKEGKNYLKYKLAYNIVKQFLQKDLKHLKEIDTRLIGVEKNYNSILNLKHATLTIKGNIDRIQEQKNTIQIMDYKTGALEASDISVKQVAEVCSGKKNKAFQLMYYALLYQNQDPTNTQEVNSGIIHLKKINKYLQMLKVQKQKELNTQIMEQFKEQLSLILEELLDTSISFKHNSEAKYCKYCQ